MSQLGAGQLAAMPVVMEREAPAATSLDPARKTVAAKVLSAMAFERVTGRKADPARLLMVD
jgi:hypothetical protein